jgi:hypothetical protein
MTKEEHRKITGFDTLEEFIAYEKGYWDCQEVMIKFIENWDGNTNSSLGQILYNLCLEKELNNEEKR